MELRREALHLAEDFREHNRLALLNLLSDSTSAFTLFTLLLRNTGGRRAMFRTIGRIFGGFSDTAKAFLIIACALHQFARHGLGSPYVDVLACLMSNVYRARLLHVSNPLLTDCAPLYPHEISV